MSSARAIPPLLLAVGLLGFADCVNAQELSGVPAKIQVLSASLGGTTEVKVQLVDPSNRPAAAKRDLEIQLEAKSENGTVEKSTVTIKQGETDVTAKLRIKSTGIVEVTAWNSGLAKGGTVLEIPSGRVTNRGVPSPAATPMATVTPLGTSAPQSETPSSASPTVREAHTPASRGFALRREERNSRVESGSGVTEPRPSPAPGHLREASRAPSSIEAVPQPSAGPAEIPGEASQPAPAGSAESQRPVLKLHYYPLRKLRADENDPATVWAALPGDYPALFDYSVYLMSDLGPLTPEPIKIPKGAVIGEAKLIATRPGSVNVWFEYSTPPASVADPPLTITFTHPVWAPKLVPIEPVVALFDSLDVAVELVNFQGMSVPADEDRPVSIRIDAGSGELSASEVKFGASDTRAMTKFIPTWPGKVRLAASSPYLPERFVEFDVATPYGLLAFAALGSLLGGVLAFWAEKSATWQRIPIGLITGYILYWALLFGVVHTQAFPHAVLLNPFSAVVLPLLGGWGGTKVITLILKPLGFNL